jgi:hypothetical protein
MRRTRGARASTLPSRVRAAAEAAAAAEAEALRAALVPVSLAAVDYRGGSRPRREVIDGERASGFLLGDPARAFFDDRGRFVRVLAGGAQAVERLGPREVQRALTDGERLLLDRARKRERDRLLVTTPENRSTLA